MKILTSLLLGVSLTCIAIAADQAAKEPATAKDVATAATKDDTGRVIPISEATLTAPLVLKDGAISQPRQTELDEGGKAVITFTLAKAGTYLIHAIANAPDEDANSFFLNIDTKPEGPLMIWDLDVTKGFEERIVSWRGNGDSNSDEFTPKPFTLSAGTHKLIIIGREPTQLKSVTIKPAK